MKINILSIAPWVETGYGRNCRDLIDILQKKHKVCVTTIFGLQGSSLNFGDVEVNPLYSYPHQEDSPQWVKYWFEKTKSDLILQHFDIWIMPQRWIKQIGLPVITYTPIDSYPLADVIKGGCDGALLNVAMSRYAEHAFDNCDMPTKYIPHWYSKESFFPEDKKTCRKLIPLPEDAFIFGVVGTNKGPRKNTPGIMLAFKAFLASGGKENSLLYLHTNMFQDETNPEGYRLLDLAKDLEILPWIRYTTKEDYLIGLPDDVIRTLYNSFDVLLHPSFGEGFGIPIIEAQACGVPVIASDNSATVEVCGTGGWIVPVNNYLCNQKTNSWFGVPAVELIVDKMILAYKEYRLKQELALENAQQYEISHAKKLWLELFDEA